MSRKGKNPVVIPSGVEVNADSKQIQVKGPKGALSLRLMPIIDIEMQDSELVVSLKKQEKEKTKFHGLYRSLIQNMVTGVSEGFQKTLKMIGVGYRAELKARELHLKIGTSHPVSLLVPEGLSIHIEKNTTIVVSGIDKQSVGQFAALVRATRPPEPFQGKGIRYENEHVRRKAGKSAAK